jgi:hypothetical protein
MRAGSRVRKDGRRTHKKEYAMILGDVSFIDIFWSIL